MGWAASVGAALGSWLRPILRPLEQLRWAAVINRYTTTPLADLPAALAGDSDFAAAVAVLISAGQLADRLGNAPAWAIGQAGEVRLFAGATPPAGWLWCDGAQLQIIDYPALYAAIGVQFGGDSNTFQVPALPATAGVGYIISSGA